MKVAILILNYDGAELLQKYLPSFQKAARSSQHDCRVAVIDNASHDSSLELLRKQFPDVGVYALQNNRVLCAYNEIAAGIDDDIVIFMNNDIRAEEGFVDPLVEPFVKASDIFFVTSKVLGSSGRYEGNKTRAFMRFGIFGSTALYPGYQEDMDRPGLTFQGGFGAFDRLKFLELGGYDDLYLPGRLEDADVTFRAYKRGWKSLYAPQSVVHHEGGVSFHKAFGAKGTLRINWRNTFLFMWKNLSDKLLILQCAFWLPARLAWSLLSGKTELFWGFCQALPLWKRAREKRKLLEAQGSLKTVSDLEIFRMT